MRVQRRAALACCRWGLAVAATALLPACGGGKQFQSGLAPIDIKIEKRTATVGNFLAYLSLTVPVDMTRTDCPRVDVYLCWEETHFFPPVSDLVACPASHSGYVAKRWSNVQWEKTNPCSWDTGVEFQHKLNSRPPRHVHAHVTDVGKSSDLDDEDDEIVDDSP